MDRRRKSTKEENALVQAAKEEVLPGYEEYLVLLQERNKLLKRLRKKNKSQIELEQKEQGFSLYVNGPHKDGRAQTNAGGKQTIPTQPKTGRKPKTAGDTGRHLILDERALQDITREEMERQREEKLRAKTAPNARERRRNWDMNSVEIKTTTGDRRKVKAPDILTGRYDDDFESDENSDQLRSSASENSEEETTNKKQTRGDPPMSESNEFNSSDSVNSADEQLRISKQRSSYLNRNSDEDLQTSTSKHNKKSQLKRTRRKGRSPDPESDSDSGGHNEKLLLSMSELKKLRHNLSMNQTIRQSIAAEVSSEDEEYEPESPIAEVDEDIPSDDSLSQDESPRRDYSKPLVKPQDTIVLDFGGGAPVNRKVEKNLSAARRKDLEEEVKPARKVRPESAGEAPKPTPRSLPPRTQSAHTLMSNDNPSKKSVRPLSAHRISSADHAWADTDADASAVMAALRAENEQASRFGKEDRAPQKKLRPGSGRELPSPVIDKTERPPKTHQMRAQEDIHRSSLVPPDKIEQIMERVLKMTPKHQRQLVKMLGNIEKSVAVGGLDSPEDRPGAETGRKPANRPMKASSDRPLQARRSLNKNSLNSVDDENTIEVHIEIKSNWGHAMRLGLTEIQLFDDHNSLVQVDPSDVTVYGAEDCRGTIDLLFNGKCKSKMERNMWSCRYHARRPVEIMILARNPSPKSTEKFSLSQMKIWNFNKSIDDLDQGVKDIRVFVGTDLVYNGTVEKGCGNQVFDYCQLVPLKRVPKSSHETQKSEKDAINKVEQEKPKPVARKLPSPPVETRKVKEVNDKSQVKRNNNEEKNYKSNVSAIAFEKDKNEKSFKSISPIGNSEHKLTSLNKGSKPVKDMTKGQRSPSPAPASRLPPNLNSPRTSPRERPNHRSISPSPNREHKKTLRSISMSSGSEASSGGETQRTPRQSPSVPALEIPRSETRTLSHASSKLQRPSVGSDSENEETPRDGPSISKARERRRAAKTPRKSKRMAARLDGHGSGEVESSKSVSESSENRPPLPPPRKSEERLSPRPVVHKPDDKPRSFEKELSPEVGAVNKLESEADKLNATGSSTSVASSMDDTPMLQKLKDMNKKDQTPVRKKEIPRWLKAEDVSTPFQSPADSYSGNQPEPQYEAPKTPPTQEEINMLIDEEMSQFPAQKSEQKKPSPSDLGKTAEQETPMKRIQQNRSKWRENPSLNLEESWGSLTQFNQHQRGRLSMDMDDDIFDEYLNSIGKKPAAPSEPPIPEEPTPKDPNTEMDTDSDDDGIVIPELPYGRELIINIRTTWGDKHYVGLTSVEIFSSTGEQVNITKIRAEPSDINVLPEYKKDPRVVGNLIDGVNRTRDDVHMWLAPFNAGQNHLVILNFDKPCKVAMIRIWNYNKSRIHSYRGAKDVMIALDSVLIFKGEIARACGGVEGGTEAFGDTILFTMDEQILEAVSQHDEAYEGEMLDEDEPFDVERPTTADDGGSGNRPFTRAVGNIKQMERVPTAVSPTPRPETALTAYEGDILVYRGNCIELNFTATWGDMHYLGLTGLEIVGKDGEALPVSMDMITANPRDVRSLPGHERDDRTLDKLVDGMNVTVSDEHMWLIPFNEGQNHTVTVNFGQKVLISGLRLWNYNKSKEDTYRGARIIHVSINGRMVSPPGGYLVRKGPGNCHFDFAQEISFSADNKINPGIMPQGSSSGTDESQNYEVIQMPCGFIYQFQLFTTWGDPYYVGLNGIELYDANLQKMQLTESNISAYPDSVNVLENINSDVRTPDKLIDGINDTTDGGHMWLAPILPSILNRVYVIFDQPTSISMIKIWNYSKNSNRGAKDFALLVDDLLVYNGELQSLPKGARGILPNCEGPQPYHTILFVNNKDILRKERNTIINNQTGEQDVQMTNDKKVVSHYNDPKKAQSGKPVDQKLRPTTSVVKHTKMRR